MVFAPGEYGGKEDHKGVHLLKFLTGTWGRTCVWVPPAPHGQIRSTRVLHYLKPRFSPTRSNEYYKRKGVEIAQIYEGLLEIVGKWRGREKALGRRQHPGAPRHRSRVC